MAESYGIDVAIVSALLTKPLLHRFAFPSANVTAPLLLFHQKANSLPSTVDTIDAETLINGSFRPKHEAEVTGELEDEDNESGFAGDMMPALCIASISGSSQSGGGRKKRHR